MTRQHGYVLTELAIVLAAVVVLGTGLFFGAGAVRDRMNQTRAIEIVTEVQHAVRRQYPDPTTYAGLTTAIIAPIMPVDMRSGAAVPTPFGGNVTVSPVAFGAEANAAYQVSIDRVPQGTCEYLAMRLAPNFHTISVTGVATPLKTTLAGQVSASAAALACGSGNKTLNFSTL